MVEEPQVRPGDLVCKQCGTGNDPARKFCRKCGNSLAAAVAAKKIPWWKRLFSRKAKKQAKEQDPNAPEIGKGRKAVQSAQNASWRVQRLLMFARRGLMLLAVVGLAGSLAVPNTRKIIFDFGKNGFTGIKGKLVQNVQPIHAVNVVPTSQLPDHDATQANDGFRNTYWAEGVDGPGLGQGLTFNFSEKVEMVKIILTPGTTDPPDAFLKQPRPKQLHIAYDTGAAEDITLIDDRKAQAFTLKKGKNVTAITMTFASVFPAQGPGSDSAIAEVEFRKKTK